MIMIIMMIIIIIIITHITAKPQHHPTIIM